MKITDVTLSILRTELAETVIPTHGAVDAMPQLVLVSVSTAEGIDGNHGERPPSGFAFRQVPKVPKPRQHSAAVVQRDITRPTALLVRTSTLASVCPTIKLCGQSMSCAESWE